MTFVLWFTLLIVSLVVLPVIVIGVLALLTEKGIVKFRDLDEVIPFKERFEDDFEAYNSPSYDLLSCNIYHRRD